MNRLNTSLPSFWSNLSFLSQCKLTLEAPTSVIQTSIDFSSAHLIDDILTIPGAGLSLKSSSFLEVYATSPSPALQLISATRQLGITLQPTNTQEFKQFRFFCEAYSGASAPKDFQPDGPATPELCPCCLDAAQIRIRQLAQNPLTAVLAHSASSQIPLLVSTENEDGCLTIAHTPTNVLKKDECLVSEGITDHIENSIRHLHAMRLTKEMIDGQKYQSLELLSSIGKTTGRISAPANLIENAWEDIFSRRDHCYEIIHS
jgi:hypothetical protein